MDIESELAALQATRDAAMDSAVTATAEPLEEVAAEEVATTQTEEAVADATDVEVTAEDEAEEAVDTAETTEEVSDDSFDDLLEDIPSNEVILSKFGNRVPQATKDALVEYADGYRNTKAQLDAIGGENGAKLLAPLSSVLTKAEATVEDAWSALAPLMQTNPAVMADVLSLASRVVLFTDDPKFGEYSQRGDAILETRFGEGVNAERIEKLVALEKGGYIDLDGDMELLRSEGTASNLYQQQAEQLRDQTQKIQELENLVNNPHLIEQKTVQQVNAQKDLETELTTRVSQSITPFRERGRWGETSALTQLAMRDVLTSLKDTPDYKEAVKLVNQYGNLKAGDAIPFPVESKLANLTRQAKGKFGELVLAINKERRILDETSTNAKIEQKVKETVPKAEVIKSNGVYDDIPPALAEIRARRDAAIAAAR